MLRDKIPFKAILVEKSDFSVLGTPSQVTAFCSMRVQKSHITPKKFAFDLDHTLVTGPKVSGAYVTCEPIPQNIALCNFLYEQGHKILIVTARRMRTHKGVVGALIKDIGKLTLEQLDKFNIKYHEIFFGKPNADFYIDEKAICCLDDIPKEIGYYNTISEAKLPQISEVGLKGKQTDGENVNSVTPLNLIIPLGGIGSRFQKHGYSQPKPFVRVLGKPMLKYLLDTLKDNGAKSCDSIILIYNPKFLTMERNMRDLVDYFGHVFESVKLVRLPGPTRGAAETVLFGVKALSESEQKNPCMLLDGDCFYTCDIVSQYRKFAATHGASVVFRDTQPKPIFSYVKVTDEKTWDIAEIIEKVKISDYANTGCYCFSSGVQLKKYIDMIIEKGEKQLSQDMKGEFYTSGVIKAMLRDKIPFKAILINKNDFAVLGTPSQVSDFCDGQAAKGNIEPRRFCIDIESLFSVPKSTENKGADYASCKPDSRMVEFTKARKAEGHYIIIQSARGVRDEEGNSYAASAKVAEISLRQLRECGIKFDEIWFGKPDADFFIDDKGINSLEDLEKVTGYYLKRSPRVRTGNGVEDDLKA
eukprot:CAMPEP_0184479924 /NCGR_PEP_ID=MMETSP0113_2-20130426/1450_1 /TAXON_ID=91329 /ORGANISM="Norrisiella sphaerica, Strain BC52" /LENGTH=585 /DNA_ID=CAMNT_0026858095 /DNA_START=15 /DNA_END=1773 /DNA_ORIENTATION=+